MLVSSSKLFSLNIYFSLSLTGRSTNLSPAKTSAYGFSSSFLLAILSFASSLRSSLMLELI